MINPITVQSTSIEPSNTSAQITQFKPISDIQLVLHTKTAENIFKQSWSYRNDGLRRFTRTMQLLWQAAKEADPYAEWYLMKIYEHISALQTTFKQYEEDYQHYFTQMRGFEITLLSSQNPFRFALRFSNPFSYMVSQLFADLDYALRQTYTLKKIGIVLAQDKLPKHLIKNLRNLLLQGKEWKYTGVTRENIKQENEKAKSAKESMGELPDVVLNREVEFGLLSIVGQNKA